MGRPRTSVLGQALGGASPQLVAVFLFSFFVNLLILTGPIFMLQVYDRVLSSRSVETLTALFALVGFLFLMMGVLDHARARVMARIGAGFQDRVDLAAFDATLAPQKRPTAGEGPLRDVEAIQRLCTSPAVFAFFDIFWTPLFVAAIFIFHPLLGWLAVGGGLILITIAILNQLLTTGSQKEAMLATVAAERAAHAAQADAEMIRALGMRASVRARWHDRRSVALDLVLGNSDRAGGLSVTSKTFRMFLQSAMLAVGAWLVLRAELSPGAMIAASIILGRALAPVEMAVNQWSLFQRAWRGWRALRETFADPPPAPPATILPHPKAVLEAHQLTVIAPGQSQAALRMVSFRLEPGNALGVIGPSGAGKSTLARAIAGLWAPAGGRIRLDGASLDQYDPDRLARYFGYLPQKVALMEGTIAENIARMDVNPDDAAVVAAAKKAGAHEMILEFADGYDTRIDARGGRLSGGQMQRVGLARALYGDPVVLILDEPNSNLDAVGGEALNTAIRDLKAAGGSVVIMAHRPAAIAECDDLLILDGGLPKAYGPRDEILRAQVKNAGEIQQSLSGGTKA